jgi:hypothetical protein
MLPAAFPGGGCFRLNQICWRVNHLFYERRISIISGIHFREGQAGARLRQ